MKVCILSMQRINNMGSLLQSYALKRIIENLGHQVEFIDIAPNEEDNDLLDNYRQIYDEEREIGGAIGKLKKIDRYALNRLKIKQKSKEQDAVFDAFRHEALHLDRTSAHYDVCVIGSDEVFNCLNTGSWGFTTQLFGSVPQADKVITYAVSCGSTTYKELPAPVADKIRDSFQNISGFSARDGNTHEFIRQLTDAPVAEHLDPVLIYDFDQEVENADLPDLPEHYCVIYSYYNRIHTREEIAAIRDFCAKNNMEPVAVGVPQFWIRNYIVCSPFQCLKVFQHADFVITDTFHGTIFSAKYAQKFAVISRKSNENKLLDLVEKINIKDHLMENIDDLCENQSWKKDPLKIAGKIESERNRTLQYLQNNV